MSTQLSSKLAEQLRAARRLSGLSQDDLAKKSGLSVSFIRLVESGKSDIALSRLLRWIAVFGIPLADLFAEDEQEPVMITRPADRIAVPMLEEGVDFFLLTPGANTSIEPGIFVLMPGAAMSHTLEHFGEESLFVVKGSIELTVDGRESQLFEGDAAYYSSTLPHALRNLSDTEPAEVLATATHPTTQQRVAFTGQSAPMA